MNALWLVLRALALPLGPTPRWALLALCPELAYPRPGVALAAEGLPDLSLVGLDDLQPAHFELRGARHSVHRRVERGSRSPVLCWRWLRFHIRIGGSDHPY